jgi:hypothetical protein
MPFPAASGGGDPSIAESLVLDETIIDELIDDISMTGSGVSGSGVTTASADAPPARGYTPEETVPQFETDTAVVHRETMASTTSVISPATPPATPTTSFLEGIFSARTEVEVSLISSERIINGVLTWNRNGLIGIESGDDFFTIPLSSISYIKTKIR